MGQRKEKERETAMNKSLGVLIAGIFVGALAAELIRRKHPKALDALYAKARKAASGAKEAFKRGYETARRSHKPATAGI